LCYYRAMQPEILCDVHLTPMTLSSTASGMNTHRNEPWSDTFRACAEPRCHIHFNRNKGYVDIVDSRLIDHKHNWCRHHKEPKAIVTVRFGQSVWQCLHENCLSRTNLLGETITVGNIVLAAHPKHGRFRVWSIGEDGFAVLQMVGNRGDGDFLGDLWEEIPVDGLSPYNLNTATE
jgi:hypothetical protein